MLHPDYANDDILICDPENEFGALCQALGRDMAFRDSHGCGWQRRLNAMYMVEGSNMVNSRALRHHVPHRADRQDRRGAAA